jgi:hypothetical protein
VVVARCHCDVLRDAFPFVQGTFATADEIIMVEDAALL